MTNEYATVSQFCDFTRTSKTVQDRDSNTVLVLLGQGDDSKTKFLLKHDGYIANSLVLYYGTDEDTVLSEDTTLTLTTHYTIDDDLGLIMLTSAGVTLLSDNNLYADYTYNSQGYSNGAIQDVLDRSANFVEDYCSTFWTDGSVATPNYEKISNFKLTGKGFNNRHYFVLHRPLPDVSTQLDGAVSENDTTITVLNTDGFPSSGIVAVDGVKLTYTGKTSTTFTGVSGTIQDIVDGKSVLPYCFEASNTPDGYDPVWTVLKEDDYDLDRDSGRVYLAKNSPYISTTAYFELAPQKRVPNRFRASYIWGKSSIPEAITQAVILVAQRFLTTSVIARATIDGVDGFSPRANDVLSQDIKMLLQEHKLMSGFASN